MTLLILSAWKFVNTPIGRSILLIVSLALWTTWHRVDAASDAREEVILEYTIAGEVERKRQLAASISVNKTSLKQYQEMNGEIEVLKRRLIDEIYKNSENPTGGGPYFTDDQLNRLRKLK